MRAWSTRGISTPVLVSSRMFETGLAKLRASQSEHSRSLVFEKPVVRIRSSLMDVILEGLLKPWCPVANCQGETQPINHLRLRRGQNRHACETHRAGLLSRVADIPDTDGVVLASCVNKAAVATPPNRPVSLLGALESQSSLASVYVPYLRIRALVRKQQPR